MSVDALVQIAVPLFIFAATMCRFISDDDWDLEEQLTKVLEYQIMGLSSKLDVTYRPVLDQLVINRDETEKQTLVLEF